MSDCIFCQIVAHTAPAKILHEDDQVIVIESIHPVAPIHWLVLPRKHYTSLNDFTAEEESLAGHMLLTAQKMARQAGISDHGYRLAINTGTGGGQTVFHIHLHLIGGRSMHLHDGMLTHGIE